MAMSCPRCNAQILDTQRFCRFCGYRLDQGIQDYTDTALLDPPTHTRGLSQASPVQMAPWMRGCESAAPPVRRRRFWRRAIPIVLVVIALNVGGIIVRKGVERNWFGRVSVSQLDSGASSDPAYLGVFFGDGQRGGAFIDGIGPADGPAAEAGLIGGDLIVQADDTPINSNDEMRKFLRTKEPGDEIRLKFLRDDQMMEAVLTPGSSDDFDSESGPEGPRGFFGIDGDGTRVRVPGRQIFGVRINSLVRNGPADLAGTRKGDIIIEFAGHPIRTYRELSRRIRESEPRTMIDLKVVRGQEELVIPVKLGEK